MSGLKGATQAHGWPPFLFLDKIKEACLVMLLFIDNYDSFTYNLVQLFSTLYDDIKVHRHDKITLNQIKILSPRAIIISPGPKAPKEAGISKQVICAFYKQIPILGVCLGMQCINECFGGKTTCSPIPIHGKTSKVFHNKDGLFKGIPSPFIVARYHSLCVEPAKTTPLKIDATAEDGVIMALSHPDYPLFGVQFHPESFLTQYGVQMARNFLTILEK
ncbi:anthranilate synthase component II [Desulfothermus okinawensis]